jgi:hypothetical protein
VRDQISLKDMFGFVARQNGKRTTMAERATAGDRPKVRFTAYYPEGTMPERIELVWEAGTPTPAFDDLVTLALEFTPDGQDDDGVIYDEMAQASRQPVHEIHINGDPSGAMAKFLTVLRESAAKASAERIAELRGHLAAAHLDGATSDVAGLADVEVLKQHDEYHRSNSGRADHDEPAHLHDWVHPYGICPRGPRPTANGGTGRTPRPYDGILDNIDQALAEHRGPGQPAPTVVEAIPASSDDDPGVAVAAT